MNMPRRAVGSWAAQRAERVGTGRPPRGAAPSLRPALAPALPSLRPALAPRPTGEVTA